MKIGFSGRAIIATCAIFALIQVYSCAMPAYTAWEVSTRERAVADGYCLDETSARLLSAASTLRGDKGYRSAIENPLIDCVDNRYRYAPQLNVYLIEKQWSIEYQSESYEEIIMFGFWLAEDEDGRDVWIWLEEEGRLA